MLDAKIHINDIKKKAKKYHNEIISMNQYILIIYIDKSGIKENIKTTIYCSIL